MIKVQCYSGYKVNERPVTFSLSHHTFKVEEIIDRWYGKNSFYFKIKADDENIYLLKYDEWQDHWDLVFYQNPRKLKILTPQTLELNPGPQPYFGRVDAGQSTALN